jgi:hypothetical protein
MAVAAAVAESSCNSEGYSSVAGVGSSGWLVFVEILSLD